MKHTRLDQDKWEFTAQRYRQRRFDEPDFRGVVAFLQIDGVSKPSLWPMAGKEIPVADTGMKWLEFLPDGEDFAVTAMMNAENAVNIVYIDAIAGSGLDKDGVAYFNDLYLDLIVYPNGVLWIDDWDELKAALQDGDITEELYALAWKTLHKLLDSPWIDRNFLNEFCGKYRMMMEKQPFPKS